MCDQTCMNHQAYLKSLCCSNPQCHDFDEDELLEEIFLSQTGEEQFQMRLSDPNAKVPMTWIVEDAYSNFTTISVVPKSQTGRIRF